jgi:hypothetical protein
LALLTFYDAAAVALVASVASVATKSAHGVHKENDYGDTSDGGCFGDEGDRIEVFHMWVSHVWEINDYKEQTTENIEEENTKFSYAFKSTSGRFAARYTQSARSALWRRIYE